jgi:hypothetical protein
MFAAYVIVTIVAIAANASSGIAAILHFKSILPGMARTDVPESSWSFLTLEPSTSPSASGTLSGTRDDVVSSLPAISPAMRRVERLLLVEEVPVVSA